MTGLPTPPAEYWTSVPWWGYLLFVLLCLFVVVVLGPYMLSRSKGAPAAMASRENRLALREAAADAERDAELNDLRRDFAAGWDKARGIELVLHTYKHDLDNAVQRANALLLLLQRVLAGQLRSETAVEVLREYQPLPMPQPPPRLLEVEGIAANNHRYK